MKSKTVCFSIIITVVSLVVTSIIPYPYFSGNLFLTTKQEQNINDFYEKETEPEEVIPPVPVIEVLNLDWFETANSFFKKYVTVRVIDILSGKEYYVQRLGGYNHADVQTIDKQNTQIFKSVYGGQWSWSRRPVWVQIDDVFVAGSTNGMPHGFSILDNGEGGHTCIHFLNSKTHGTKRVDPEHQKAIAYAYEHRDEINKYIYENKMI